MIVEIIVFGLYGEGDVNLKKRLSYWISFFDKPQLHFANSRFRLQESACELGFEHECSAGTLSALVCGVKSAGGVTRKAKCERSHAMRCAR